MRQLRRWRGPALLLALLAVVGVRLDGQTGTKLDSTLSSRVGSLFGQSRVVITARNPTALATVEQAVRLAGGTLGRSLPIINGRAAVVPNSSLALLAANPLVEHISDDRIVVGANERTGWTIGSTPARAAFGLDGSGVTVAVIDSGVAGHDDLADAAGAVQRVDRFVDFVQNRGAAYDDYGHGTHVAGIIAGNGFDSSGARAGVAPGAHLVALKVLDGSGGGRISDTIAALDYVNAHASELNIRVVNLSIASAVIESYTVDPLAQAAKRLVDGGIVVVAAAGNGGRDHDGNEQYGAITAPGNAPWVLTVGASSHMGTTDRSDDIVAPFSSRGPTAIDRIAKPDLVAPGVGIESLAAPGSGLYNSMAAYRLDGTVATPAQPYLSLSGTSMAAPVVAGTVALMLQANPSLSPTLVKAILEYTAQVYPGYDALTQGAGFVNAFGAVELARSFGLDDRAQPFSTASQWGGQFIWGNQRTTGGQLTASASAWGSGITWGQATAPSGSPVEWGVACAADCDTDAPMLEPWSADCLDFACATLAPGSSNVVWRSSCGLAGCLMVTTIGTTMNAQTVVWGTASDGDTVVWGTSDDGDTVVWGTACDDDSCEPIVWGQP